MNIVTHAANSYIHIFSGYVNQFLNWGKWLFFSLLVINLVWLALWYAFDRHALAETLPAFLKKFFAISFFYTIMIHPAWLGSILHTAQSMGQSLVHEPIDPSSIIAQGLGLANKLIVPVSHSSLLTIGFVFLLMFAVYIVVLFVFISIALDLALTLITTTALISIATFFLGFAALGTTNQIARQTLDVILANCVKLLGIYLVVAAGSQTIAAVALSVPAEIKTLDPYAWIVAVAILFWLLAKHLPNQFAKIFSGAISDTHGEHTAAMMMAASHIANATRQLTHLAATTLQGAAKLTGSTAYNALQHVKKAAMQTTSGHPIKALGTVLGGTAKHFSQAVAGNLSDHVKNISNQFAGGSGLQQPIQSVSSRMYQASKNLQTKTAQAKMDQSP